MTNIIEDLNWRYAVKKFDSSKNISDEKVEKLIEAFRLTPSSLGVQPWKLIYVTDMEIRKQLAQYGWNESQILDSTGVFVLTRTTDISEKLATDYIDLLVEDTGADRSEFEGYEKMMKGFFNSMDEDQKIAWADRQVMIALGNMLNVAAIEKVDSCPIEGFNRDKFDEILGLKEKGLASVVLLPIGVRSDEDEHFKRGKHRYSKERIFEKI